MDLGPSVVIRCRCHSYKIIDYPRSRKVRRGGLDKAILHRQLEQTYNFVSPPARPPAPPACVSCIPSWRA